MFNAIQIRQIGGYADVNNFQAGSILGHQRIDGCLAGGYVAYHLIGSCFQGICASIIVSSKNNDGNM